MNLYLRDYSIPTLNEKEALDEYRKWKHDHENKIFKVSEDLRYSHPDKQIRTFLWHYTSLFPNNHLLMPVFDSVDYEKEADLFCDELCKANNELKIQQYIKANRKWFIPGSIFLDYNFGHHDAYLFPEQSLGGKYYVDYLLVGFNSDGCNLVFIEFENPNAEFMISTAHTETEAVRKGLAQIRDWREWMDDHRANFLLDLGITAKGYTVPTTRIYYYLVVSRRDFMNEEARVLRSQLIDRDAHLKIVTYDRLTDNLRKLSYSNTW